MRCFRTTLAVFVCLCVSSLPPTAKAADRATHESSSKVAARLPDSSTDLALAERYGSVPLSFEANQGQSDGQVRFLSRGSGYSFFLTRDGALLTFARDPRSAAAAFQMQLAGANPQAQIRGLDELPGKSNYFFGNDARRWRTSVPTYSKVAYENIYPGINLVYYGTQRQLEYDFVLAPGADPKQIQLAVSGADQISVDAQGNLVLHSASGDVQLLAPNVYQQKQGQRHQVTGQWVLTANNTAGFRISDYDRTKPLVIDPVLQYSSFIGGSQKNALTRIAIDAAGNAYVAGYTASGDFPAAPTPQAVTFGAGTPSRGAFVAKIDPTGSTLLYSTYLSGSVDEEATGLAVDAAGNVYVAGTTHSPDFPTLNAFEASCGTHTQAGICSSAFLTKINPSGDMLLFSTYLGGSGGESAHGLAIDSTGSAYVVGVTSSLDFPVTSGAAQTKCAGTCQQNAFVAKFSPAGDKLSYATYLGGSGGADDSADIAVDASGSAYITGHTTSPDFPAVNAYQKSCAPDSLSSSGACVTTAFLTKLKADGSAYVYSTYLGGTLGSQATGIAVDSLGSAYVTGSTSSSDFPVVKAYQKSCAKDASSGLCSVDAFATKFAPSGKTLVYSTYLGGSGLDEASGIALDATGNAHIVGRTESADFPAIAAKQKKLSGQSDAFVARLNAAGSALSFSTYHGGSALESGNGIAVDLKGNVYVTGETSSSDFPTLHPFQSSCAGTCANAFVSKMALPPVGTTASNTVVNTSKTPTVFGESVTFTATVTGASGTPTGTVDFLDGTTSLGTATLDATGTATFNTSTLTAGSHTINGNYSGDATYAASSGNVTQVVDPAATMTAVSASPLTSSTFGQSVTFTAAITAVAPGAGTPVGTVDFSEGGTAISGCTGVAVNGSGSAGCTTSALAAGSYTIKATYNPTGGNFAGSNGTAAYTVNPASTTTNLSAAPPNSAAVGQSVTFTATISAVSPGSGTPVGTVDFTASGTAISGCTGASVNSTGVATCTTSTLAANSYTIKATYNPTGGNFTGSNKSISYTVATPPTIAKSFAAPNVVLNNSVSMTITITNPNTGLALTGVAFTDPLPAGLVVGPAGLVSNSCNGTPSATVGSSTVSLAGGTIPASGSCSLIASIKGITAGTWNNTTGAVSSTEGGTGSPSNTAPLTVQDFNWAISSSAATVIQGTSTATAVVGSSPTATATPVNGYNQTITVLTPCAVSPATATITCSPSPATIAGGSGSSVVTINTTGATPIGVYTVTIEGIDQSTIPLHHSQNFTLTVECTWNVSPATQTVNADASTGGKYSIALTLTAGQQCPWAATSTSFISLGAPSGSTGASGTTLQFDVTSFYGASATAPRTGTINLDFTNGSSVTSGFTQPTGTSSVTQNEVVMTSISPAAPPSVHVNSGSTIQFTTIPTNTGNLNLLWTLASTNCANGGCGSITSAASVTGTYTAPANIATSAGPHTSTSDTVEAASQADPTKLATSPLPAVSILNDPPTCAGAPGILAAPTGISGADPVNNPVVIELNHTCTDNLDNENDLNSVSVNYGDSAVSQVTSFTTTGSQGITQQYQYGQNATFAPGTTYLIAETPSDTSTATGANTQAAYLTITYRASDGASMHVTANGSNTQVLKNTLTNQDIQTFFTASGSSDPCVTATNSNALTVSGVIKFDGTTDANNFGITCSLSTGGAPWTLTVNTTAATNPGTSRLASSRISPILIGASLFGLPGMVIIGLSVTGRRKCRRSVLCFATLVFLISLLIFTPACGGGIHAMFISSGTKDVVYFLTVSGTDNNGAQQTYIVPVTVAPAQ